MTGKLIGPAPATAQEPATVRPADTVLRMMVTDLSHFLGLPEEAPGPPSRLAGHLGDVVRATTAGDAGEPWESALPCRRRPSHRACPGRMIVIRAADAGTPIQWQCSACGDKGVISHWEDSPYELRR